MCGDLNAGAICRRHCWEAAWRGGAQPEEAEAGEARANPSLSATDSMTELYRRNPNTKCAVCDNAIYRRPIEMRKNKGRAFCSMVCYGRSIRKEIPCTVCLKPIMAGSNKKTCSRVCANTLRAGMKYRGRRPKDKVSSERALKKRLLIERGLKCERCGYATYQILQVHHKDRDRTHNDLKNLELICPNCHSEEHYKEKSWLDGWIKNGGVG